MKKYVFYFLAFFLCGLRLEAQEFALDTEKTIWHEAAAGENHKALLKEKHQKAPVLYEDAKKEFQYEKDHPYCRENRRALDLIKNENNYTYVRWRGGLFFKYHNCKTGSHATFKARARRMRFEYKHAF